LYKWRTTGTSFGRKQAREGGELAFPGNGKVALTVEQQENVRLKRELERVKQERDILKKAVGFFARESR
jgi:transposase